MGLQKNIYKPCLYKGSIQDLEDPSDSPDLVPLTLGLYVDDFFFFSTSDDAEAIFQKILSRLITVDSMGVVEYFLSIHFSWRLSKGDVNVHMD